jgi:hypothetical protein
LVMTTFHYISHNFSIEVNSLNSLFTIFFQLALPAGGFK